MAKLTPDGNSLRYATYLGGSAADSGRGLAVAASGAAYITGETQSNDFPTQNPFQAAKAGNYDVFVAHLSPEGTSLIYATYLGGTLADHGYAIAVAQEGSIYVTGRTNSSDFPTRQPLQGTNAGGYDVFVAKFNPTGNSLDFGTYLGGTVDEYGHDIAVSAAGAVYIAGFTFSYDFPTYKPLQGATGGNKDAFVIKILEATDLAPVLNLLLLD